MIDKTRLQNAFEFVVIAGARARQLMRGAEPRVERAEQKPIKIAQREVLDRKVEKVERAEKGEQ